MYDRQSGNKTPLLFSAGIDGGGTKTTVMTRDLKSRIIQKREFGPFNLNGTGEKVFCRLLEEITGYLTQIGTCCSLCIGAAGISNTTMRNLVEKAMASAGITNWKLVGDHEIALYGALNGQKGISVIAGTGSIVFGRGEDGKLERSGGWGHVIGDEGSGYALGRDGLYYAAKEIDGYGEDTLITRLFAGKCNLDTREKIISYVYSNDKSAVASLAPIVEEAAEKGDKVALSIIDDNSQALVDAVLSVSGKLNLEDCNVAMLGGLISHDTLMRKAFVSKMKNADGRKTCIDPILDAATGALLMAGEMIDE